MHFTTRKDAKSSATIVAIAYTFRGLKSRQDCFCDLGFARGPRTPLLTALPRLPSWISGAASRRGGKRKRKGTGRRKEEGKDGKRLVQIGLGWARFNVSLDNSTHFRSFRRQWGGCGISQDCSHSQSPQCVRCWVVCAPPLLITVAYMCIGPEKAR